jgi:glycosyltransferase involved in cell wall biosynthesis
MKVSGFSFCRNAVRLYYPIAESIRSALPLVDEFVIAVGESDDATRKVIEAIDDPKIRIIDTVWDETQFVRGATNSVQTNIALDACTGDWCVYLQADEVLHEQDLPKIREAMQDALDRPAVEGLLFNYLHFWATYEHVQKARNWYRHEVRVIRNNIGVRSWTDAQGFRIEGRKLHVVSSGARIFHYGWVRPPQLMSQKTVALATLYHGRDGAKERHPYANEPFDYGELIHLDRFNGSHPAVMEQRIQTCDWTLPVPGPAGKSHEHNRRFTRFLGWVERNVLRRRLGEYRNYELIG